LDSPLQKLDRYDNAPAEQIRGATRHALRNLVNLAIESDVDLVVIAGDLYDGDWHDQNTGLAFVEQAARLTHAKIPLLVIRGNHDAQNQMTASLPLPKNPDGSEIMLDASKPETRILQDLGIAVHGQSFRTRSVKTNLAAKYPPPVSGLFNLGMLHTGLEGETDHADYAPCSAAELTDKGYDYWALGHVHTRSTYTLEGGPPIVFSGNPQGRHMREQDEKGCILINVDASNRCQYHFEPLDVVRWKECKLETHSLAHRDEVCDAYQDWITGAIEEAEGRLLVTRVRLEGVCPIHQELHRFQERLRSELQAISISAGAGQVWLEDLRLKTNPPTDSTRPIDTEGPAGSLATVLTDLRNDAELGQLLESELAPLHKQLNRGLKADASSQTFSFDDRDWVKELLDSAAADVFGRLHDDTPDSATEEASR
jgi:DNA repair exonuclease SbcCD nuclease subunit